MSIIIDQLIMFLVGAGATAIGLGWIAPPGSDDRARQQFMNRFGKLFRIIGPSMIVIAVILATARLSGVAG
jgi:hypothetical protein